MESNNSKPGPPRKSFARLKGVLESLEGHEKYRANTNSPSDGDDVRWYFSKSSLSLQDVAASTPLSEVVGKSDFLRFGVNDSLDLEAAFLKEEEELVSAWWKEYAECSEGPLGFSAKRDQSSSVKVRDLRASSNSIPDISKELNEAELYENDEVVGISVKGGLYEVDLYRRRCFPVYWTGDHRRVLRGHWFAQKGGLDWWPLREDVAEQLEFAYRSQIWHRRTFQPSGKFAARVNLQSTIEGLHALFSGEDDTWEAWLGVDSSGLSSVLGFKGNGFKLRRGFAQSESSQPTQDEMRQRKEEAMDDYCSQVPVRHLVFMVHGIGQRLENANFIDDVGTLRQTITVLADQHLTSYQRNSLRVLFIPCQWRRGLKLGGERAVEKCTLEGVRALRTMLSATVHDVLYYMSPVYCQDIMDSVSGQLNMLYRKFIKRNPGYDGKVSIYGHSLGSVLTFDILCHQSNLKSSFPMSQIHMDSQNWDDVNPHTQEDSGFIESEQNEISRDSAMDSTVNVEQQPMNEESKAEIDKLKIQIAKLKAEITSLEQGHKASEQNIDSDLQDVQEQTIKQDVESASSQTDRIAEKENKHSRQENCLDPCERSPTDVESSKLSREASCLKFDLKPRSSLRERYTPYIEYTKLAFEVDTFFAVGSPLGVFLSLRNIRLGICNGKEYWKDNAIEEKMPACKRLFNIFHPFDPVAYRLEPLVCKEYTDSEPVFVPYHRGGRRLHIGMQEFGKEMSARSRAFVQSITTAGDRVTKVFAPSPKKVEEGPPEPKVRTYGSFMIEKLTGELDGRIDFMLQDATFEHQYLQAISSHTAYWQDADTSLFILKHLYRNIPEESPDHHEDETAATEKTQDGSQSPKATIDRSENDVGDEEVAFTFSRSDSMVS